MAKKISVLIADDEEHIRKLMEVIVTSIGCEVVGYANDGGEAVAKFKSLTPDITLLDINMPKMSGIEALDAIIQSSPDAFVVMLTAKNNIDTVQKCISKGAKQYLLKDTPMEKLSEMIGNTIKQYVKQCVQPE